MRTRSSSNLPVVTSNPSTSNPKRGNRRCSKQPFILEKSPIDTMADQRTMAELLRAPTEGYAEAIVVPLILTEQFELKHSLVNMMTSDQFFRLEKDNSHDHIRWFNKITSTIKYKDVPNSAVKLMLFSFSLAGATRQTTNLRNEISNFQQRLDESFYEAWDRYKDLLRACPYRGFTELHQLDTFYNALNPVDQDSLNTAAGDNLLERRTQDVLTIIENKSKVRNSRNKSIVSQVKSSDANSSSSFEIAKLTHAVNQQTSVVTTAMTAILKQFQATPPPASVKVVEDICCLTIDGNTFPELQDNIQGYVSAAAVNYNSGNSIYRLPELQDNIQGYVSAAAVNYNSGNSIYRLPGMAYQIRPLGFAQPNVQNNQNRFGQPQGFNRGNNFNPKQSYQAPTQQNQVIPLNELEKLKRINETNMKAIQNQINIVKNELRNEMKNLIQASLSNHTNEIKNMMASLFQMNSASTSGGIVLDGPTIPTPPPFINSEEDERVEETLTDLDLAENTIKVPPPPVQKYKPPSQIEYVVHQRDPLRLNIPYPSRMIKQKQQEKNEKMLKALLSNKEKLQELANTPLYENCSTVILKKLPEKLRHPGKFLIPCGFSELKCKALADLGASINLMPLSVWKKLADFVIVDYKSDPRPSGNSTFSSHPELTLPEVKDDIFDLEGGNVLSDKLLHLDSTKDLHPPLHVNPLSGSTTYSSSPNPLLEELADELALITFPLKYDDDLQFNLKLNLKGIEFMLHQDIDSSLKDSIDQSNLANPTDNFVDSMPEMFIDEHALDYSSPSIFDEYDDDFLEVESDTENVYDDPFESKGEKIKESKLLIDELDLPCDFLPLSEYDSFIS
nr:hypothetical protein [Tanacetum cinerariifolium]